MEASASHVADWFYQEDGHRKGPVTEVFIIGLIKAAKITYGSLVWKSGFPEWLKVEDTELRAHLEKVSPPPITGKHVNNTIVWILAFAPMIGLFLEAFLAYAFSSSDGAAKAALGDNKYWFITLALNIGLSYVDENRLGRAGYDTSKFKGMTWLVPVYLFKRAKALNQSLGYFIVWLVCFVISLTT
jgi:hypothetical protein